MTKPYRDPDTLRRLYWDEELTQRDIAEEFSVDCSVIHYWMDKHGIERRSRSEAQAIPHVPFSTKDGYEQWMDCSKGNRKMVRVHQLLAISEGGDPYNVFSDGEYHVHHKNGVKWDNRPSNVGIEAESDHHSHHKEEKYGDAPYRDESILREMYIEDEMSTREIAEELECGSTTIGNWLHRFDIPVRL